MIYKPSNGLVASGGWKNHVLAQDLVDCWLLGEGGGLTTYNVVRPFNGTLTNMSSPGTASSGWGGGPYGPRLRFDGTDDYVAIPTHTWPTSVAVATIIVIVNTPGGTAGSVFSFGDEVDNANRVQAHIPWSDNNIYWDYGNVTAGRLSASFTAYLNKTTHVALVSAGATGAYQAVYINGVLVSSKAESAAPSTALTGGYIGRLLTNSTPYYATGSIDGLWVYTKILPPSLIALHARNPYAMFQQQKRRLLVSSPAGGGQSVPSKMRYYRNRRVV